MTTLGDVADKIRSKNAGPFWLTIDIFCNDAQAYARVARGLQSEAVSAALGTDIATLKRFDMSDLWVVKFSLPRPQIQGVSADRDMHGASFGLLLTDIALVG